MVSLSRGITISMGMRAPLRSNQYKRFLAGGGSGSRSTRSGSGAEKAGLTEEVERPPVRGTGTKAQERLPMRARAVTFIAGEAVLRIPQVKIAHQSVAVDLGDDRGGGDRVHVAVPAHVARPGGGHLRNHFPLDKP